MAINGRRILNLDPRTKMLLLVAVNFFIFTNSMIRAEYIVMAFLALLLLLSGLISAAIKGAGFYLLLVAIQFLAMPHLPQSILSPVSIVVMTFRKMAPCIMLGALLMLTTPIRLIMYSLQKIHIPQSVIIPLAITLRYFPTIREEQVALSDSMKMRNVRGFRKLQFIYVPLMLSASMTADELSQAISARGIDNPGEKTCSVQLKFHIQDYLLILTALALDIWSMVI